MAEDKQPLIFPMAGPWTVQGSERKYDWIGPKSTIPGLGFVFLMFDRLMPFTKLITAIRRFFGRGSDDLGGTFTMSLSDCTRIMHVQGMTLERIGNVYKGHKDVGGTLHEFTMTLESATKMVGRFDFSLGNVSDRMTAEQLADVKKAGIDPESLNKIKMEHVAPMTWTFAGDLRAASAMGWVPECIELVEQAKALQEAYQRAYEDPDMLALAEAQGWDYEEYTMAVWHRGRLAKRAMAGQVDELGQQILNVAEVLALVPGETEVSYQSAGSASTDGTIEIRPGMDPVRNASTMAHEQVHQEQFKKFKEEWKPDGVHANAEDALDTYIQTPGMGHLWEPPAYQAGIDILQGFIDAASRGKLR